MRHDTRYGCIFLALASSMACTATSVDPPTQTEISLPPAYGNNANVDPPNTSGVGAGTGADTGLPCDVQQVLENRCIGCHAGSSPPPLLTYADLVAPSPSDPTKKMAQAALARMKSTTAPMPPSPALAPSAVEIATFETWVDAHWPKGATCTTPPANGGGQGTGTATDAGQASLCTSQTWWSGANVAAGVMRPGGACLTCHQQRGGPAFVVAGTIYPTAHEPNDCNGKGGPPALSVVITDGNNKVTTLTANAVGNFYSAATLVPPFSVKLTDGTNTRSMKRTITAGDCNSCHTETGANGAPGRIMAP